MASLNSDEQPLFPPSSSANAALDHTSNERQTVQVLSSNGILLKSWQIFRRGGFIFLPLAVFLQVMTYVSLPWFALNGNNWASPLVRFFTLVGALGLTLVLTMETALAVYVTRKDFQGDGSPSTARIQASETLAGSNIGGPWQIWGTSVINSVILYGLGTGTFLAVARVFFTLFPWFSPQPPHTRLEVALFFLFCISLITLTTSLGSTLILALPAAFIEGSTSIASNLRSVRLGKGQRLQMFGLFAFSLMFNPLVDYIFLGFTPHLWGSSWVVVATVLGFLAMGPAVAYFQVVWVVAYLSARKREDPTFAWPSAEEALLV